MSSPEPGSLRVLMLTGKQLKEKKQENPELTLTYCVIKLLHGTF